MEEEPIKIKKNMQIVMSNDFPKECRWNLRMNYTGKMICAFLGFIDFEKDEDFVVKRVKAKELADFIGIKTKHWRDVLGRVAEDARKGSIFLRKPNGGWRATGWVFYCDFDPAADMVEFCLDGKLKPFFLNVLNAVKKMTGDGQSIEKVGYYHFNIDSLFEETGYNLILMIIAERYARNGGKEYSVEEFCTEYNLPKSYRKFGSLKQRILDPSIAALNKTSDKYSVELFTDRPGFKRGNKILKFFLKVSYKQPETKIVSIPEGASKEEKEIRRLLSVYGITNHKVLSDLLRTIDYDLDYVKIKIKDCSDRFLELENAGKPILPMKKGGYIITALNNDYPSYRADLERRLEIEEKERLKLALAKKQAQELEIEKERQKERQKEYDAIIASLTDEQKSLIIQKVKEEDTVLGAVFRNRNYTFDEAYELTMFRGHLMNVYAIIFQPTLF